MLGILRKIASSRTGEGKKQSLCLNIVHTGLSMAGEEHSSEYSNCFQAVFMFSAGQKSDRTRKRRQSDIKKDIVILLQRRTKMARVK